MKTVFLGFAYRPEDRELSSQVEQLLASHGVRVTTGERLAGAALTPAVQQRIDGSDGLVGLLTRREQLAGGGWTTHQWVLDELAYARNKGKHAVAMVEDGVDVGGMFAQHERINLDRQNPLSAFLALSETMGLWKAALGRVVRVRLLPDTLGKKLAQGDGVVRCRHRFHCAGRYTEWKESAPYREPGGTFLFLEGVQEDYTIQIEVEERNNAKWVSDNTPQWMPVQLARRGAGR
jgi:hypothetical protein